MSISELVENAFPFVQRCGYKVLEAVPGRVHCLMPLEGNGNHINTMYAGALFTLGEVSVGALAMASFDLNRYYPIVKEVNIKFLKTATSDISVEYRLEEAEIIALQEQADASGKAEFTMIGDLQDKNGDTVAVMTGTFQVRTIVPPAKN